MRCNLTIVTDLLGGLAEPAAPVQQQQPGGMEMLSAAEAMKPVLDADAEVIAHPCKVDSIYHHAVLHGGHASACACALTMLIEHSKP